ncbi:MAG: cysteine--tRNA ligase [Myxococcota bacterium]|nr:cysteine--tRNA ligase [Myxococcota bacterium]
MPAPIQLYNSLNNQLEPLETREEGKVGMYVCGMTVYDYCHIGHARAMLTFDLVVRHLRHRGYEVTYVRNHTDVDDKIIARANEKGQDPLALAQFFIDALDEDLSALGTVKPDHEPRVSQHIGNIISMNQTLVDRGHAYEANGSVYFAVESFPAYGELSGKRLKDLIAGERVAVDPEKRSPADFALWKAAKPGECSWDSPWGKGRPGWHIECSAMSHHHLGTDFDIHGGGIDLIFPHHENEVAQSTCATGENFARYWMHNGHLCFGTEKMSKSLGNIVRIRDIVEQVPAEALRLLYFEAHYRSPLPYSTEKLASCVAGLNRLYQAKEAILDIVAKDQSGTSGEQLAKDLGGDVLSYWSAVQSFEQRFNEAMDSDFNSAKVIGDLYDIVRCVNRLAATKSVKKRGARLLQPALDAFELCQSVLGIGGQQPEAFFNSLRIQRMAAQGTDPAEVEALLEARTTARTEKNWSEADRIRDELAALKVEVMDRPEGTTWRARID